MKILFHACLASIFALCAATEYVPGGETKISIVGNRWHLNGQITYQGARCEGLLMNVRMVNSVFEDANDKTRPAGFDVAANTAAFIKAIPNYVDHGVRAFTLCLQGGSPAYDGAVNSAFNPDGSLRDDYLQRIRRVIETCDRNGAVVILGCYYQRQDQILLNADAVRAGVVNVANWIKTSGFTNVILEIANEFSHNGFDHPILKTPAGEVELIQLAKRTVPGLLVGTSGLGSGKLHEEVCRTCDFLLIHFNTTTVADIPQRINALKKYEKPIVCNEDDKIGAEAAAAAEASVDNGASWGFMHKKINQYFPWRFDGAADDPVVYAKLKQLTGSKDATKEKPVDKTSYFPPADESGGWRSVNSADEIRKIAQMDKEKLDAAFELTQGSTKNGGLLVLRNGWLVYERYFGQGHREATPNLASCGKSFTSVAVGILLDERRDLFPDGLDQKIFTPVYFPPEAFPLSDPRKQEIKLGQLLAFSAGIRGNNPSYVRGQKVTIDPPGPDGSGAMADDIALGRVDKSGDQFSAKTLWCEPGEGYSYATSSIHLASIMLRHVTGHEMRDYVDLHLAKPLGWGRWSYGYRQDKRVTHTPGGGGIALRGTDMLRFGYLLLREGRWNEQQLIPADYVRHATRASKYNQHFPYSLQFDVNTSGQWPEVPRDAFWKSGSGGHALYVVPSLDLVVWKLGGRDGQYSPNDTGLPIHPDAARQALRGEGWKETVDAKNALQKTLALVIASIGSH